MDDRQDHLPVYFAFNLLPFDFLFSNLDLCELH